MDGHWGQHKTTDRVIGMSEMNYGRYVFLEVSIASRYSRSLQRRQYTK